jgi:hypothetical protein
VEMMKFEMKFAMFVEFMEMKTKNLRDVYVERKVLRIMDRLK